MKKKKEALDVLYPELDSKKPHCNKCGRIFQEDDKDYITVEGNIYARESINLLSRKEQNNGKTRICMSCLIEEIEEQRQDIIDDLGLKMADLVRQIDENKNRLSRKAKHYPVKTCIINACICAFAGLSIYDILTSPKASILDYAIFILSILVLLVETIKLIHSAIVDRSSDNE